MISYLKGKIKNKGNNFAILDVNNVGYKVFVLPLFYGDLRIGQDVEFYTYQQVREDALNLYGFKNMEDLELFELLLSVSGIGPKSALGIMSAANADDVKESIYSGDPALLAKVAGIGRKTSERVVLELKEKIRNLGVGSGKIAAGKFGSSDEIDALMALGYSLPQAREALNGVGVEIKDSGERIRHALKALGR